MLNHLFSTITYDHLYKKTNYPNLHDEKWFSSIHSWFLNNEAKYRISVINSANNKLKIRDSIQQYSLSVAVVGIHVVINVV